jgi:hypothetical protein
VSGRGAMLLMYSMTEFESVMADKTRYKVCCGYKIKFEKWWEKK